MRAIRWSALGLEFERRDQATVIDDEHVPFLRRSKVPGDLELPSNDDAGVRHPIDPGDSGEQFTKSVHLLPTRDRRTASAISTACGLLGTLSFERAPVASDSVR